MLLCQKHFDAVVIGHSVPPEQRQFVISAVRAANPDIAVFFVYIRGESGEEPLADESVDITGGPRALILALESRLRKAA